MWDNFEVPLPPQPPTSVSWVGGVSSSFLCPPCMGTQGSFTPGTHRDPPVPGPSSWAGPFPIPQTTALHSVPIYRHASLGRLKPAPP